MHDVPDDTLASPGPAILILPNILPVVIVIFSINVGGVIISEASLSFLGFGLPPSVPSWGAMLSREGREYMQQGPWLALWPGLCLTIVVYSLNMFGDAVRDLLDPRLRGGGGRLGAGAAAEHGCAGVDQRIVHYRRRTTETGANGGDRLSGTPGVASTVPDVKHVNR